jgi:8-oxo-dGTP pyrophosphatase MutT (NUDIX family)
MHREARHAKVPARQANGTNANVVPVTETRGDEQSRWRTFGERTLYQDEYVWLGQVDVGLPDGERIWHDVVRLHSVAEMALLDEQDRVLLLWRHRFVPDQWGWELPGGLVDAGEKPAAAAIRELREETGYRAGSVERMLTFQPTAGRVDSEHVVFVGRDPERVGEPTETNEAARLQWVPLASVRDLIVTGEIWNAGALVALLHLLAIGPPALADG